MEILSIYRQTGDENYYMASYSADGPNEALHLAYQGTPADAVNEALNVWGLSSEDVTLEFEGQPFAEVSE